MPSREDQTGLLTRPDAQLQSYYASLESRLGYRLFLGDTRHFGYYESDKSSPFPIPTALRRMEEGLANSLGVKAGAEVLDAGCGVGHVAIYVASHLDVHVQAIDIVEKHVQKARRNVKTQKLGHLITAQTMDFHDLSKFESSRFDAVYTMETFVHARDPAKVLAEFFRVLKPGGRLIMREYDHQAASDLPTELRESMTQINKYSAMPGCQMFERGVLENLLKNEGFNSITVNDMSSHVLPLLWLFFLIAYFPYFAVRFFRLQSRFVNAMAAVEGYRAMKLGYARYIAITAVKDEKSLARRQHVGEKDGP